jgi:CRISPR-associated protein Csm3
MSETTSFSTASQSAQSTGWVVTSLQLQLECVSGLRIAGPSDRDDVDIPVHRDHRGLPIVPGSSLKGVLRSLAERVLRAKDEGFACDIISNPCGAGETEFDLDRLCWCCRLFGSSHMAGRISVGDLVTDEAETVVRDGVGIDRNELKAAEKVKFDYEVVAPSTVFAGEMLVEDPEPGDIGLLLGLLDLIDMGVAGLGGGTSRGLGRVRLRCAGAKRVRASSWSPGDDWETVSLDELERDKAAAAQRLARNERSSSDA